MEPAGAERHGRESPERVSQWERANQPPLLKLFQPARDFLGVLATVEGRYSEITFALRAKSGARCNDHIYFAQHSIEHLPARKPFGCSYPDVRRIRAAING